MSIMFENLDLFFKFAALNFISNLITLFMKKIFDFCKETGNACYFSFDTHIVKEVPCVFFDIRLQSPLKLSDYADFFDYVSSISEFCNVHDYSIYFVVLENHFSEL